MTKSTKRASRQLEPSSTTDTERPAGPGIAGPSVTASERDELTEWVNIIAFAEKQRRVLASARRGDIICVMGPVIAAFYRTRNDERRYSRTIIAEAVMTLPKVGASNATDDRRRQVRQASPRRNGGDMILPVDQDETPTLDDCPPPDRSGRSALQQRPAAKKLRVDTG